jgi:hypothetical protein
VRHITDDVARILASPIPRREAFTRLTGVLFGGLLGSFGIRSAYAQQTSSTLPSSCKPACKENETCCGTTCINPHTTQCCQPGNTPCPSNQTCCGSTCIDPKNTQCCTPGNTPCRFPNTCCGGTCIGPATKCCTPSNTTCSPPKQCCGGVQPNNTFCITPPKQCSNSSGR